MKKMLFCLLLTPILSFSQEELPRVIKDTLFSTSGFKIVAGDDIKLGAGSLPNGDFKYISISAASWAVLMDPSHKPIQIGRRYSGLKLHVKKFRKDGNKKRGYVYYLIVGGGNIANYDCDIENAIVSGEVVVPEEFRPKSGTAIQVTPTSADELKKLKDLLDSGALTKDEYDSAKKKILAKM